MIRRVPVRALPPELKGSPAYEYQPGDMWRSTAGWMLMLPCGHVVNLSQWSLKGDVPTDASPSIRCERVPNHYHGTLQGGVLVG